MAMLDSIRDTLNKGVAAVSVKSETLVESSRIKTAISNTQKRRDAAINALGAKLYSKWKAGQADLEQFSGDLEEIQAMENEIAELTARLEQLKADEDKALGTGAAKAAADSAAVFCSKCGKALPAGSRFCDECGSPVG